MGSITIVRHYRSHLELIREVIEKKLQSWRTENEGIFCRSWQRWEPTVAAAAAAAPRPSAHDDGRLLLKSASSSKPGRKKNQKEATMTTQFSTGSLKDPLKDFRLPWFVF